MTRLMSVIAVSAAWLGSATADEAVQHSTETYKSIGDVELKIHIFRATDETNTSPKPAIVFFFGGGWTKGSPKQFFPHCEHLAERGMVAMSAEYRIKSTHGTSPKECVADAKSAVRWVRSNAERLGIDPTRVAAGGGSAGGHLAAAIATTKAFDDEPGSEISCVPNALVLFNPVLDASPGETVHSRVADYYEEFSPYHNLRSDVPPMIVFLGTKDKIISVENARKFEAKVKELGGRCELKLYEGQPHGFFNYRGKKDNPYYHKTVTAMDEFLGSLDYLSLADQ